MFGTYDLGSSLLGPSTSYESRLSEYIQTAWATFAKNPMGGPGWTQYPNTGLLGGKYSLSPPCFFARSTHPLLRFPTRPPNQLNPQANNGIGGNIAVQAGYGVNSNPSVLETNVPSSLVDARCALYAPLYAAAGT